MHVRLHKIRERLQVVNGNISAFAEMRVNPGSDEYFFYLAEMSIFEELNELIWILQDEIDDLQSEILAEIYGHGPATQ